MDVIEDAGLEVPDDVKVADVLTRYAVAVRYPRFDEGIGEDEYRSGVDLARRIIEWAERAIGVQPQ